MASHVTDFSSVTLRNFLGNRIVDRMRIAWPKAVIEKGVWIKEKPMAVSELQRKMSALGPEVVPRKMFALHGGPILTRIPLEDFVVSQIPIAASKTWPVQVEDVINISAQQLDVLYDRIVANTKESRAAGWITAPKYTHPYLWRIINGLEIGFNPDDNSLNKINICLLFAICMVLDRKPSFFIQDVVEAV